MMKDETSFRKVVEDHSVLVLEECGSDDESSSLETDLQDTDRSNSADREAEKIRANLGRRETTQVFRSRMIVFAVLFLAAAAVSVIVYFVTSNSETAEYVNQFEGSSTVVLDTFLDIVRDKLAVVSSLAVALIAQGVDSDQVWPYVTISSFQQRASTARAQSGTLYVQINPYVRLEQREDWELFAVGPDADWM